MLFFRVLENYTTTCTLLFIVASFIIVRKWKKRKCPSIKDAWKKMWHIHAKEYYLVIKSNGLASHEKKWMNLKFPSKRNLFEKATCCVIPVIWNLAKGKSIMTAKRSIVSGAHGKGESWITGDFLGLQNNSICCLMVIHYTMHL